MYAEYGGLFFAVQRFFICLEMAALASILTTNTEFIATSSSLSHSLLSHYVS